MTEDELKKLTGTNVRYYRKVRKWNQAVLAKKLNMAINSTSYIETGKKGFSYNTMTKLASVFNIEPFELFKPPETPTPEMIILLSRFNNVIIKSVAESINDVYHSFVNPTDEKSSPEGPENPVVKDEQTIALNDEVEIFNKDNVKNKFVANAKVKKSPDNPNSESEKENDKPTS